MTCYKAAILFFFFTLAVNAKNPPIQVANVYHDNIAISDYFVSEKLDGIRAYWNGKNLMSRQGNIIHSPKWFTKDFPDIVLDGELFIERGKFELIASSVLKDNPISQEWQKVKFMIFDMPNHSGRFSQRLQAMKILINQVNSPYLQIIEQSKIDDKENLMKKLDEMVAHGAEGLMLRKADSFYQAKRNDDLIKLKKYQDAEAKVIAHIKGKGKYQNMMGSLLVENIKDKMRFRIGTGFSDKQRKNPPKIGDIITYKYYGKTKNNIPRFASFIKIRFKAE